MPRVVSVFGFSTVASPVCATAATPVAAGFDGAVGLFAGSGDAEGEFTDP